ncbi:MAG: dihydrolipoamide acetyltransferase, partial [Solimonas sp.]
MATIEVKVPDIGDYHDVPVIEVLVKVGDTVKKDQGLITLESDKATLEVPSSAAGVIKELKVKLGDTLSEGAVVAVLESEGAGAAPPSPSPHQPLAATSSSPVREEGAKTAVPSPLVGEGAAKAAGEGAPQAAASTGRQADIEAGIVVLGAGPGGYT